MVRLATAQPCNRRRGSRHASVWGILLGLVLAPLAMAIDVRVESTPAGEVFPALELSQGSLDGAGDVGSGLLRLTLVDVHAPRRVRVTLGTQGLAEPTVLEADIAGDVVFSPRLRWSIEALKAMKGPRRQMLEVSVESPGRATVQRQFPIRLHPLDEALYFVREGGARIDLGWAFAAWVDPQHPVVDELLELAGLDARAGDTMASRVDVETRRRLVEALWIALERRGLRYSSAGTGISQGPVIYSQRVRLLSTTWADRIANCLDGSVLIASALERLGIGSFLVLVPGHAFVGYYTDPDRRRAEFLETTLLGAGKPKRGAESEAELRERARAGFAAARRAGAVRYREALPKLDGRHQPDFALIDISTARAYGIMPLPFGPDDRRSLTTSSASGSGPRSRP